MRDNFPTNELQFEHRFKKKNKIFWLKTAEHKSFSKDCVEIALQLVNFRIYEETFNIITVIITIYNYYYSKRQVSKEQ